MTKKRLIIGITGASGIIYGIRVLQLLASSDYETHLVISKAGQLTCSHETELSLKALQALASYHHNINDVAAGIASGSFKTEGMIIAPCSMRTLADIASGTTSTLLTRAADVVLKERRKLVMMVRETPLHLGHIENMQRVTKMGAIIAPPTPAFYNNPQSIMDIVDHSVGRVFDLFDIDIDIVKRWK